MKYISHRGNIRGSLESRENSPSYIDCAIGLGYDVEVDVRYINEKILLGHDLPQYEVNLEWLSKRKEKIWLHCKDLASATFFSQLSEFQYFCHSNDPYVLTSNGLIWVHDLSLEINSRCIIPLMTKEELKNYKGKNPFAICTDNVQV